MTQEEKISKRKFRTDDGHLILMTPEEKDLFILDLTARLKYGVICLINRVDDFGEPWRNEKLTGFYYTSDGYPVFDFDGLDVSFAEKVKPFLRPMSSMTEEEKSELSKKYVWNICCGQIKIRYHSEGYWDDDTECSTSEYLNLFNWLNSHHFDYRGLIEKGLAIEAPKEMYQL